MSADRLIPRPQNVVPQQGERFTVDGNVVIVNEGGPAISGLAKLCEAELTTMVGTEIQLVESEEHVEARRPIRLILNDHPSLPQGKEAYVITASANEVSLLARKPKGLRDALITLLRLVQFDAEGTAYVDPVIIEDAPRFGWRGLSLDVARSFYPVDEVKEVIDLMFAYKMNVLHLHLSDDQGWRLEIPSRPELTEISGKTAVAGGRAGHYTIDDYKGLVDYAAARGVEIVPEFDTPGHVNAATHAHADLNPDGQATDSYDGIEVGFSRLHGDLPETSQFLEDVFSAAAQVTPGKYIHVGGDEVYRMEKDEYTALLNDAAEQVHRSGKSVIAWQEAASPENSPVDIIQFWLPSENRADVVRAARAGTKVVMSPSNRAYLDMKYDQSTEHGATWAGLIELDQAYGWDPSTQIRGVPEESVKGVEAAVWTEKIHDLDALMYMLLPRLPAIAEVGWSAQEDREFRDFAKRIAGDSPWWDDRKWSWHQSPGVDWN